MPDDQAKEKSQLLEQFGAEVVLVKPVSIVNAKHYVNEAKRLARNTEGKQHGVIIVLMRRNADCVTWQCFQEGTLPTNLRTRPTSIATTQRLGRRFGARRTERWTLS
jgi:cysteine synthase